MLQKDFIALSKYAGQRFDLVQAGGGNTSVKLDKNIMLIKSSGYALSEVEQSAGFVEVHIPKSKQILEEMRYTSMGKREKNNYASEMLLKSTISSVERPSIETFLHLLLDTYVLHTHPIVVNAVTSHSNWKEVLSSLFPKSIFLEYHTPGIELALALQDKKHLPEVIFMQNHGLIVHGPTKDMVIQKTENVLLKIEEYLNVSLNKFKITNQISNLVGEKSHISYLSQDETINNFSCANKKILHTAPLSPDTVVYCGFCAIELTSLEDRTSIVAYKKKYNTMPKIIIYKENVFFIAQNIKKAKKIEEVFKAHLLTVHMACKPLNFLSENELLFLSSWEIEKYRANN